MRAEVEQPIAAPRGGLLECILDDFGIFLKNSGINSILIGKYIDHYNNNLIHDEKPEHRSSCGIFWIDRQTKLPRFFFGNLRTIKIECWIDPQSLLNLSGILTESAR